jgi:hypothetical protein
LLQIPGLGGVNPGHGGRVGGRIPGVRGTRGGRGAAGRSNNRGAANRGAKRKGLEQLNQGQCKKRNIQDSNWGAEPIVQQPLGNEPQWYTDSYSSTWG